jgi:hypothetical protein
VPGIQDFTYANIGHETVRGTAVAPTRQLYTGGTGVLDEDPGLNFHEGENRGVRTRVVRATQQSDDVNIKLATVSGVGYDDLVMPLTQLKGGMTGVGGGADKTWTATPAMTGANNPESWTLDVGDDVQNYRVAYVMAKSWKLSAGLGDVTQLEMNCFGKTVTKPAKATPATNASPKIPGDLWTVKFATTAAGLAGASISTNFLIDWDLDVLTGLVWRHYMDGTLQGAQHVETSIDANLAMTVESTALAVSEFYDKWKAQTLDFVRLKATGPTLGASNYSAQVDVPILYTKVEPIGAETDGINMYKMAARLAYDPTSAASIAPILVGSLAAIP